MASSRGSAPRSGHRETAKWAVGLALVITLTAALFSLQLYQMSGEASAKAALSRIIDALAEGDASIARQHEALTASAEQSGPDDPVTLDDYPVSVTFTRTEVIESTPEQLAAIARARAIDRVYADGAGVLRDSEATAGPGRFSAAGAVDAFLGLLTEDTHTVTAWLTFALVALGAGLALALASLSRGYGRIGAPGVALAAAAAVLLAAGAACWTYASASDGSGTEYVQRELLAIGKDLAGLPLRNGAALAALGFALAGCGAVGGWLDAAVRERERGIS